MKKPTAIILSGALAKGAYEAGVLNVITQNPDLQIKTIVASSSGALNATCLAAGITSQKLQVAMDALIETWVERGSWTNILDFSIKTIFNLQGLSTSNKLKSLIKTTIENFITNDIYPIELKFVLTQLSGRIGTINGQQNTTFETVANFNNMDFYDVAKREHIYTAAVASAAFPGLFAPVNVSEFGACYDGGLVNSTPIKYALENKEIERIIIISPFPSVAALVNNLKGLELVSKFGDVITNERLYRDLVNADKVNTIVKKLNILLDNNEISEEQYKKIDNILSNKKEVEIIQIRPAQKLDGNGFSGLFKKSLRQKYIEEGMKSAEEIKF